jgi:nitrous oxidase accessory protein NosD
MFRPATTLALALCLAGTALPAAAQYVVRDGESIQDKIDSVPPGSTIFVKPGVYRETGATRALTITKNNIHLIGMPRMNQPVVLIQSGTQTQGIWVSPADSTDPDDPELPPCGVSNQRIRGFALSGFTVQGFSGFGVYLTCVDGFNIHNNISMANLTYSIFPVRSSHGNMWSNLVSGTQNDACLYVGQDETVSVHNNTAYDCIIGMEIENSHHIQMFHNVMVGNTAGLLVDIVGNRQVTTISDNFVTGNTISDNNRPNTAPPEQDTSQIPPGIGFILEGADRTFVANNVIKNNDFAGFTLVSPCAADPAFCTPPIDFDPNPDGNRVINNTFLNNHTDVIYLPDAGQGNCFAGNHPAPLKGGAQLPRCK